MSLDEKKDKIAESDGFVLLRLHYSADESKDAAWAAKEKLEYASDVWEREFELKAIGHGDSSPVFNDYSKTLHEDPSLCWLPSKGRVIYRGWDFGKVHPCVVFMQVDGLRRNFIDEIYESDILIDHLVQKVMAHSNQHFPNCTFVDWVDVSGRNTDQWGHSSMGTLRNYGLQPKGRDQTIEEGIQEMKIGMVRLDGGRPYFMLNPVKCPHLAAALRGGYKRNQKGEIVKDGTHDHPVDAARYAYQGASKGKESNNLDSLRAKMKAQYNRFPKEGKSVWR